MRPFAPCPKSVGLAPSPPRPIPDGVGGCSPAWPIRPLRGQSASCGAPSYCRKSRQPRHFECATAPGPRGDGGSLVSLAGLNPGNPRCCGPPQARPVAPAAARFEALARGWQQAAPAGGSGGGQRGFQARRTRWQPPRQKPLLMQLDLDHAHRAAARNEAARGGGCHRVAWLETRWPPPEPPAGAPAATAKARASKPLQRRARAALAEARKHLGLQGQATRQRARELHPGGQGRAHQVPRLPGSCR